MRRFTHPEENLAKKWAERLQLTYPIDIRSIIDKFAEVEFDSIPIEADAILISCPKSGGKPLVILSKTLHGNRLTFTLAHELGHILIPWHSGIFACSPMESISDRRLAIYLHKEIEAEANRFASEILMPASLILSIFSENQRLNDVFEWAETAKISRAAISIKLSNVLPAGFIVAETESNMVLWSKRTTGTFMDPPVRGSKLTLTSYKKMGATVVHVPTSSSIIYWIDTRSCKIAAPEIVASLDSRIIIKEIIDDLGCADCRPSINGVIGAANGMDQSKSGDTDFFTILKSRFEGRDHLNHITNHERFDEFLAAKAREILEAKRARETQ